MWWTIEYDYKRVGTDMQYNFKWKVYLNKTGESYFDYMMHLKFYLGGSLVKTIKVKDTTSKYYDWTYSGETGWITVSNKTSGTTPFYAVLTAEASQVTKATSSTYQLAIVPAASALGAISNFNVESSIPISITKYNSSYTDTLVVHIDTITIKTVSNITNGEEISFTPEELDTIYGLMQNVVSKKVIFSLITKSNGVELGKSAQYAMGSITNANPTFASSQVSFNDSNSTIAAITGSTSANPIIVKGKSTLAVTYTAATANKGATISKYEFTLNGVTKTSTTAGGTVSFGTIDAEKDLTLTVRATDSRGNYTEFTKIIPIVQYVKPTVAPHSSHTSIVCARCDSAGTLSANGEHLKLTIQGKWFPLTNQRNTATLTIEGISADPIPLNDVGIQSNGSGNTLRSWYDYNAVVPNVTLKLDKAYFVTVKCTDQFGEYGYFEKKVPSEDVNFHQREGGFGAAFGEYSTEPNVLAVAEEWTFKAKGGMSAGDKKITNVATPTDNTDGVNKQYVDALVSNLATSTASVEDTVDYVVEKGTSGIWTYRKWNSGIAECWSTGYVEENVTSWSTAQTAQSNASIIISHYKLLTTLLFPFKFVNTPSVQVSGYQSASIGTNAIIFSPIADGSGVTCYTFCLGVSVSGTVRASYYAIGKWK